MDSVHQARYGSEGAVDCIEKPWYMDLRVVNVHFDTTDPSNIALIDDWQAEFVRQRPVNAAILGTRVDETLKVALVGARRSSLAVVPCGVESNMNLDVGTVIVEKFSALWRVCVSAVSRHVGDKSPIRGA